ncbi:lysM domain receptor-like kinase 3 [Phalaenopsis equestris]|uniref:lysM domain receptor-like kinase 3 n=1 Tax=Phalaenopsis equestris TaxID=78828 RepID=UPI0009E40D81|nr:lysM domain receptor-like kinase 3 [Phalaenopsis equestris]
MPFLLLLLLHLRLSSAQNSSIPITCKTPSSTPTCNSFLYAQSQKLSLSTIASIYSSNTSLARNITRPNGITDFLLQVPCTCIATSQGTTALFYDTTYRVIAGDTADGITSNVFSGLAWKIDPGLQAGQLITVHLPCGCLSGGEGVVVSYAVEMGDTVLKIGEMFSADTDETIRMNSQLAANPDFLNLGWVLFVPMGTAARHSGGGAGKKLALGITIPVIIVILCGVVIFFLWRRRSRRKLPKNETRAITSAKSGLALLESQYNLEGEEKAFDSDRPVIFSLEEVERATSNFDNSRVIGVGGFGSVYYGILADKEVAIKKMKSNMSKEFFAELKVLCKVHHINVVELIGFASGDDHLYLVYEYLQNGSLSDHLHDPLLKGHQPLSWTARAQIALDTARGIEYIHDFTKSRYVHRDIKSSNILLDNCLRAKVGDFGLAKLVERSSEDELIATKLVGTPGYLPPESLMEFQTSTKTDVFAFGVVIAELITGCRALSRDNKEATKMKSLVPVMKAVFNDEDPESALEEKVEGSLRSSSPMESVFKMAEIAAWCLSDDPFDRPEISEITAKLSQILSASIEWEASMSGSGDVFSGVLTGR